MSQFDIDIQSDIEIAGSLEASAREAAEATLIHQGVDKPTSLTILLTDDARLRQLNNDFLGYDEPTDVLSFPAGEIWPGVESYLGDIAVSIPRAQLQAEAAGHSPDEEVTLLVVHGLLHLLDFDHVSEEQRSLMSAVQSGILCILDVQISDPFPEK